MGIFEFLFGNEKTKKNHAGKKKLASQDEITFFENFITISALNFFGPFKRSPSGEWIIAWSDSDDNEQGGSRKSGFGRYVLYNAFQNKIELQGKLERPNSGNVSNKGAFSIEDWHFGNALSGTFYVFSVSGTTLIKRHFNANIYNTSISESGLYAVCQTANSPGSEDGNLFTAFDTQGRVELFAIHPTTGWADDYKINEGIPLIGVNIKGIGKFNYDVGGNFVDSEKFEAARLNSKQFHIVLLAAEDILKNPELNDSKAKQALNAATRARTLGADNDSSWKALALKIQGLAHEHLLDLEAALIAYDEAMKINPKIGVKRKADGIRKTLSKL